MRYIGTDGSRIARDLTRLAHQSVAAVAVIPLQDLLELGAEGRMNVPGRPEHNWTWRFTEGMIQPEQIGLAGRSDGRDRPLEGPRGEPAD